VLDLLFYEALHRFEAHVACGTRQHFTESDKNTLRDRENPNGHEYSSRII
jgi:hypothetical protein